VAGERSVRAEKFSGDGLANKNVLHGARLRSFRLASGGDRLDVEQPTAADGAEADSNAGTHCKREHGRATLPEKCRCRASLQVRGSG
jgi:hypothetical protein